MSGSETLFIALASAAFAGLLGVVIGRRSVSKLEELVHEHALTVARFDERLTAFTRDLDNLGALVRGLLRRFGVTGWEGDNDVGC